MWVRDWNYYFYCVCGEGMLVSISSLEDSVSWLRIVSCNSTCRTAESVERQESKALAG